MGMPEDVTTLAACLGAMGEGLETAADGTDTRQAGTHTANRKEERRMETADHLLDIAEAAHVLHTSRDWLYRNWKKLPFVVALSPRQLRFSLKGIEKWIEEQQHAGTRV
jgi:predicted DNA-binding transcriptional regulator AlpA